MEPKDACGANWLFRLHDNLDHNPIFQMHYTCATNIPCQIIMSVYTWKEQASWFAWWLYKSKKSFGEKREHQEQRRLRLGSETRLLCSKLHWCVHLRGECALCKAPSSPGAWHVTQPPGGCVRNNKQNNKDGGQIGSQAWALLISITWTETGWRGAPFNTIVKGLNRILWGDGWAG